MRHALIRGVVLEKAAGFADDPRFGRADKPCAARLDGLGALGDLAQNENRATEARSLLLDSARVSEDQRRRAHELDQRHVVERRQKRDPLVIGEALAHRVLDVRVQVNRIDDLDVVALAHESLERTADGNDPVPEALAAMGRDEHDAAVARKRGERSAGDLVVE